ncbi:MAG: type II secretion system F family protein, partial [Candidatus Anstonellales archaeon]
MGLIETVGNFLPELGIFSQKTEARISALLKKSAIGINVRRYLLFSVLFSILVLIFVFLIAITITGEIIFVVGSVLVFFGIALYGCLHFPAVLAKKRAEVIESELAFVLREIALFIDLGMPFEKALEKISEGKYAVSEEFRRAMGEIRGGSSAISAISNIATRVDSRHVLRAVNLLVSAYEYGTKGENLRRLADDLVDIQKTRNREYSSRLSFVGLFFIAVSALLPAFFQVMLVVFSSLPQFDISLYQLWIGFLIVFPLINLLVLILVWKMMPPAKTGTKKFDIRGYLKRMRVEPQVAFMAAAASIVIGVLLLISGIFWAPLLYLGCLLIIFPICAYWIFEYVESRRNQEIENAIPDALFHAASLQNIAK